MRLMPFWFKGERKHLQYFATTLQRETNFAHRNVPSQNLSSFKNWTNSLLLKQSHFQMTSNVQKNKQEVEEFILFVKMAGKYTRYMCYS